MKYLQKQKMLIKDPLSPRKSPPITIPSGRDKAMNTKNQAEDVKSEKKTEKELKKEFKELSNQLLVLAIEHLVYILYGTNYTV